MKMGKQIISLLLALALVLGMVPPVAVWAAEADPIEVVETTEDAETMETSEVALATEPEETTAQETALETTSSVEETIVATTVEETEDNQICTEDILEEYVSIEAANAIAIEEILTPSNANGNRYTNRTTLANALNSVFAGDIDIFSYWDRVGGGLSNEVQMPLGMSMSTSTEYYIKNKTNGYVASGYQCHIYANAVYNKLFDEWLHDGSSISNSQEIVISKAGNTASFSMFDNAKVKCGAYFRSTANSNGSYNGSEGHSLIILSYDPEKICYLEGNGDGKGLIRIVTRTWAEFNNWMLSGQGRYICHVIQPSNAKYDSKYKSCDHSYPDGSLGVCSICKEKYTWTLDTNYAGVYEVNKDGTYPRIGGPYDGESKDTVAFDSGSKITVYGRLMNAHQNYWYQVGYQGKTGYIYESHLTKVGDALVVTYNANGGSGAPGKQTKVYGTALKLSSTIPTRSGYTFLGWSNSSTATSATYAAGGTYAVNASATLYAVWQKEAASFTINFYPNGASDDNFTQKVVEGKPLGSLITPHFGEMYFEGWYTAPYGGTKVTEDTIPTGNMSLYAHWVSSTGVTYEFDANGATIPGAVLTDKLDGVNIGRPGEVLCLFNKSGTQPGTNIYGVEVAVDSTGKITGWRDINNEKQLTVPDGGFVLSGQAGWDSTNGVHVGGALFVWAIFDLHKTVEDIYVSVDYETGEVKVYDSYAAYRADTMWGRERMDIGTLPVPTRSGYVFRGWQNVANRFVGYYDSFPGINLRAEWYPENDVFPNATIVHNGHLYERYDSNVSWTKAKEICESKGGYLVAITDAQEQAAIVDLIQAGIRGSYRIGASDVAKEGTWTWMNGETFSYENWDKGAPEPNGGEGVHYASIMAREHPPYKEVGEWIDEPNVNFGAYTDLSNTGFICEYDYADLSNRELTVTFDSRGGNCDVTTQKVIYETAIGALPVPTKAGYRFVGWYTSASSGTQVTENTVITSNITVYARWVEAPRTITYYTASGAVWRTEEGGENMYYLPSDYPKLDGAYFSGWAYSQNAKIYDLRPDDIMGVSKDIDLYPLYVTHEEAISGNPVLIYNIEDFTATGYEITEGEYEITETVDTSYWTDWSAYSTTAVSGSDTVEVRTTAMYQYYYFLCSKCGDHNPLYGNCGCGGTSTAFYNYWSTIPYAQSNSSKVSYATYKCVTTSLGDGQMWYFSTGNLNHTAIGTVDTDSTTVVIVTGYSSRTYVKQETTETEYLPAYVIRGCSHEYTSSVTAPTCTAAGYTTYTCKKCGHSYVGNNVAAKGHTEVIDSAVAATCTAAGKTQGKHCSVCNEVIVAQQTVAAKGHTEVIDAAVAATCTTAGKTQGKHCSVCNTVLVAQQTVAAKGHTEVIDAAVEATCTTAGKTQGKHCSVCNTVLVAQQTVATKGHTEVNISGKAATCTQSGLTDGKKCSTCGIVTVAQQSINAKGHSYTSKVTQPTCTERGYTTHTCICGDSYIDTYTNTVNHAYQNGICANCGEKDPNYNVNDNVIASGSCGENLIWTLNEDGMLTISGTGEMTVNSSADQPWLEYAQTIQHVSIESGVTNVADYAFIDCTSLKTVLIPDSVTAIGASAFRRCTELTYVELGDGVTNIETAAFRGCTSLCTVSFGSAVSDIGNYAFYGCTALENITFPATLARINAYSFKNCENLKEITFSGTAPNILGDAFADVTATAYYPKGEASWTDTVMQGYGGTINWVAYVLDGSEHQYVCVITEPTCTQKGYTTYTCSKCGDIYVDAYVDAKGHTEVIDVAVAATCTASGKTQGKHCSVCNTVLVAQQTVAAKGHTEVIDAAVAATCTATGKTEGKHCSVCNTVLVAQQTVAAKGHTEVIDAAVAATCTASGKTQGKHCSVCNTVLVAQQTVAAKGHTEVIDAAVAATCTATGKTQGKHCSVCNTVLVAQQTVAAKGHSEVIDAAVAATCTATGKTQGKHCSVCNAVLVAQQTVAAKGHTEVIDAAVAATCTASGKTQGKHCSVCGEILIAQEIIPANGHSFEMQEDQIICSVCGEQLQIGFAQDYVVLNVGESVELEVSPAEFADTITWTLDGDEGIVTLEGNVVTAVAPGSVYVDAAVIAGEFECTVRFRVDVVSEIRIDGVQLSSNKATAELYKNEFTTFEILLQLPQNYATVASVGVQKILNNGIAIDSARFTNDIMAQYFELVLLDDRTVQIVPTEEALANVKSVKGSYAGTVTVTVDGQTYETEKLTLTVKKTMPKLKATVAAFNSYYAGQSNPIVITGGTVTEIRENAAKNTAKTTAIPNWVTLEDGVLTLNENAPAKNVSGNAYIEVLTEEWRIPAALTISVKNNYKVPGVKLAANSIAVAKQSGEAAVQLQLLCTNKTDVISDIGITSITASEGYTVENFNEADGTFNLTAAEGFKAGKVDITVRFGERSVVLKLTVKTEIVKLKLSASKVTLNKDLGDVGTVNVTWTTKGYAVTDPVLTYDAELLDVQYANGKLAVTAKAAAAYGKTYAVSISAYEGAPAVKLNVAILKQNVVVKSTIKATGALDVIRDSTAIIVVPTYTNVLNVDVDSDAVLKIYSSVDKFKEAIAEVRAENGVFTIDSSVIRDHSLKYKVQLETVIGDKTVLSNLISLNVKMGTAKLTVKAENATLFAKDKHDRAMFWFETTDATLNEVARVEFKNVKQAAMFEIIDYGDGTYGLAFKGGNVDKSLIGKSVSVALNIFLEGNRTAKANVTVNVKLTITK